MAWPWGTYIAVAPILESIQYVLLHLCIYKYMIAPGMGV